MKVTQTQSPLLLPFPFPEFPNPIRFGSTPDSRYVATPFIKYEGMHRPSTSSASAPWSGHASHLAVPFGHCSTSKDHPLLQVSHSPSCLKFARLRHCRDFGVHQLERGTALTHVPLGMSPQPLFCAQHSSNPTSPQHINLISFTQDIASEETEMYLTTPNPHPHKCTFAHTVVSLCPALEALGPYMQLHTRCTSHERLKLDSRSTHHVK